MGIQMTRVQVTRMVQAVQLDQGRVVEVDLARPVQEQLPARIKAEVTGLAIETVFVTLRPKAS